jgi:Zn-dependent protease with chaperone function
MMDDARRKWGMVALAALWVLLAAGEWVAFRQTCTIDLSGVELPAESVARFAQAETFTRVSEWAALCDRLASFPPLLLVLLTGWAVAVERRFGATAWRWPMRIAFIAGYALWADLLSLPHVVLNFGHQKAFDLTPLTGMAYTKLILISMPVPLVLFFCKRFLVFCCMPIFGRAWWVATPCILFLIFSAAPEILSRTRPLDPVETLTPLADPALEAELDVVAHQVGMDLDYYVVDQSKRSTRVNMYVTGRMGREYVVMTDTLVDLLDPRELGVILAHEALHQHWRFRTLLRGKAYGLVFVLCVFWIVHRYEGGGAIAPERRLQVVFILLLVSNALGFVLSPYTYWIHRQEEQAADRYALEITGDGEALHRAILKVSAANLTSYDKPAWAHFFGGTHPRVKDRLALARAWPGDGR